MDTAEKISLWLEDRNMSQGELAKLAGIDTGTLSRLLSRDIKVTLRQLKRLWKATGLDLTYLVDDSQGYPPPPPPPKSAEPGRVLTDAEEDLLRAAHRFCPGDPTLQAAFDRLMKKEAAVVEYGPYGPGKPPDPPATKSRLGAERRAQPR